MRRFSRLMAFLALCVLGFAGCGLNAQSVVGKYWPSRSKPSHGPTYVNPLRERADAASEQFAEADPSNEREAASAEHSTETSRKTPATETLARFDMETQKLIQAELANTPPGEKEQFYKDVVSLPPAMVRQIIRMRRVVRQAGQDAPHRFVSAEEMRQQSVPEAPSRIQLVAGEEPADEDSEAISAGHSTETRAILGRDPARDPGLGAADPWNRETSTNARSGSGGDSSLPPSPLPFNQIPARPGADHFAGYGPGTDPRVPGESRISNNQAGRSANEIQPPPGGALSPVNKPGRPGGPIPRPRLSPQNARIPTEYNPLVPPVPNYARNGGDPFAPGSAPLIRSASRNPDQKLPGVGDSLNLADSFGPPPTGTDPNAQSNPAGGKSFDEALAKVVANMEKEVGQLRFADQTTPEKKHAYIQKHVYLRMLYLMAGREAQAVTAIPDIPAADQEFWQQTLWAMSNYFDFESMPQDDYRATQTIAQLRTAIQKLQENARLELRNVAFCHKISSFGNFDRFPRDEFGPGQPVLVYAEVANFKSVPTTLPNKPNETAYRTQLKSSIEIHRLGPNGELVERFDFEPTEDYCHNHRRDYFHSYEFTIPQRISLGPHVMTLTVEDQLSRKVATYSLNFMVQ